MTKTTAHNQIQSHTKMSFQLSNQFAGYIQPVHPLQKPGSVPASTHIVVTPQLPQSETVPSSTNNNNIGDPNVSMWVGVDGVCVTPEPIGTQPLFSGFSSSCVLDYDDDHGSRYSSKLSDRELNELIDVDAVKRIMDPMTFDISTLEISRDEVCRKWVAQFLRRPQTVFINHQ